MNNSALSYLALGLIIAAAFWVALSGIQRPIVLWSHSQNACVAVFNAEPQFSCDHLPRHYSRSLVR